ncbi:MAG TPA: hypothetical protein VM513_05745 [Kofleriaceae bacterium]|jgi:hypothetical protein|nr:hypothetical protein [Kofleriaceae bacterium]
MSIETLFGSRTAITVPDVVSRDDAAAARERAVFSRYALLDRGSYDVAIPDEPALCAIAIELARVATGRSLAVDDARMLRLVPGDYLLAHHDRVYDGFPVEVMLDLSPAPVPGAEVHYRRRGQAFFRAPCVPGSAAIVERGPTVTSNHTYVSKLHAGAVVVRLIVLLR